jgi:hypothetical protein
MKMKFARRMLGVAVLVGSALIAAPSYATITIFGNENGSTELTGADYEADLTYAASSSTAATLTIDFRNISDPLGVDGFMTAFVFNNPGDAIATSSLDLAPAFWTQLGLASNAVNGSPFGQFDLGASSTGDFEGGGSPNNGIPAGDDGTFRFAFTGTGLDTLTEQSFVNEFSVGPGIGGGPQFFVARFRGLVGDASDKVPAIPEPSTYAVVLAGLGLLAFAVRRTRRL